MNATERNLRMKPALPRTEQIDSTRELKAEWVKGQPVLPLHVQTLDVLSVSQAELVFLLHIWLFAKAHS